MNPLHPLSHGNVLIVGVKSSNLSDEIRTHPRVTIWDSQQKHWTDKDIPSNTRAVFVTRFIGHQEFANIIREARKKQITIFNPEGTGMIARQVKELLNMTEPPTTPIVEVDQPETIQEETIMATVKHGPTAPKLHALVPYIDFSKQNIENARTLMARAKEMKIDTTMGSLAQLVSVHRRRLKGKKVVQQTKEVKGQTDVSVEILDGMIKELKDMRDYLVAVTKENQSLKMKVDKFKRFFDE